MIINKQLMTDIFGENNTNVFYDYYKKNKNHSPFYKVSYEKVSTNYPGLSEDEKELYAILVLCPYHSSFSMFDLKIYFKKLSDSKL